MEDISSTALVTVQAYRNIAQDPVKRGPLINVNRHINGHLSRSDSSMFSPVKLLQDETSIQFLAYALGEKNLDVIRISLDTLQLLSDTLRHRQKLAQIFGVLEALQATADNEEEYGEELSDRAAEVFTALKFAKNSGYGKNKKIHSRAEKSPSTEEALENEDGLFGALDASTHSDKGHRFLKHNSKAKTMTIQVTGLATQVNSSIN